jgi:tRNA threonylcarbamoyladenosine biosynthesis protein TsaE
MLRAVRTAAGSGRSQTCQFYTAMAAASAPTPPPTPSQPPRPPAEPPTSSTTTLARPLPPLWIRSAHGMHIVGALLAAEARAGDVLCLNGDLGVGKSCLARGFVRRLLGDAHADVPSPTFLIDQAYDIVVANLNQKRTSRDSGRTNSSGAGRTKGVAAAAVVHHMDFYRFNEAMPADELAGNVRHLRLEDAFENDICVVEWAERLQHWVPRHALHVDVSYVWDEAPMLVSNSSTSSTLSTSRTSSTTGTSSTSSNNKYNNNNNNNNNSVGGSGDSGAIVVDGFGDGDGGQELAVDLDAIPRLLVFRSPPPDSWAGGRLERVLEAALSMEEEEATLGE